MNTVNQTIMVAVLASLLGCQAPQSSDSSEDPTLENGKADALDPKGLESAVIVTVANYHFIEEIAGQFDSNKFFLEEVKLTTLESTNLSKKRQELIHAGRQAPAFVGIDQLYAISSIGPHAFKTMIAFAGSPRGRDLGLVPGGNLLGIPPQAFDTAWMPQASCTDGSTVAIPFTLRSKFPQITAEVGAISTPDFSAFRGFGPSRTTAPMSFLLDNTGSATGKDAFGATYGGVVYETFLIQANSDHLELQIRFNAVFDYWEPTPGAPKVDPDGRVNMDWLQDTRDVTCTGRASWASTAR